MQVRMMCQLWNEVEVTILPHYVPSQAELDDPAVYADNVRQLYSKHLGLPLTGQVQPCTACCAEFWMPNCSQQEWRSDH